MEDSKGFIWFATDNGVVKYDGEKMKVFTTADGLPKNDIFDLKEDSRGRMWLMCQTCDLVYIKNDIVYPTYSEETNFYFFDFMDRANGILWQDAKSVFVEKNDTIVKFRSDQNSFEGLSDLIIWNNSDYRYIWFESKSSKKDSHHKSNTLERDLYDFIRHRSHHSDNRLSFYDYNVNTIYSYDALKNVIDSIKIPKTSETFIHKLRVNNSNLELVTEGNLYKINPDEDNLVNINIKILEYCQMPTSFIQRDDELMVSTLDQGVLIFIKNRFQAELQIKGTTAVLNYLDSLIIIGDNLGKIHVIDDYKIKSAITSIKNRRENDKILRIDKTRKLIYFYSKSSGLNYLSLNSDANIGISFLDNKEFAQWGFRDAISHKADTIFTRERSSIGVFNEEGYSNRYFIHHPLNDFNITKEGRNLAAGGNKIFFLADINRKSIDTFLLDYNIHEIEELGTLLLFGTDGRGIYTFNPTTGASDNILSNKSISDIKVTHDNIMVSTPGGALILQKEPPYNIQKFFTTSEGLLSNEVLFSDVFQDKYMFITREGVQFFDTSVSFQNYDIQPYFGHPTLTFTDTLEISGDRSLTFDLNKIDFLNKSLNYQVSFSATDDNFVKANTRTISYQNLDPGTYKLRMYAENKDYDYTSPIVSKTIIIPSKIYERSWFQFVIGVALLGLAYLAIRYRFKSRQRQERKQLELEKEYGRIELQALQSQLNPHFVFNCLASIQVLISNKNFKEANSYLTKFSRLMRQFLDQSTVHFVTLQDEIQTNRMYLELEKLRFKEKLNFDFHVDDTIDPETIEIPSVLLQPYVENAIRHGLFHKEGQGSIALNIKEIEGDLVIEVIDDGIGIEEANKINAASIIKHKSKGTKIMERKHSLLGLIEDFKFDVRVIDRMNEEGIAGTIVRFTFPGLLSIS